MQLVFSCVALLLLVVQATAQLSEECMDDASFRLNGNDKNSCAWAAQKKTAKRCRRTNRSDGKKMSHYCPLTCKMKCESLRSEAPSTSPTSVVDQMCYNDDPIYTYKNKEGKNCEWASRDMKRRCNKKDKINKKRVSYYCPSACDLRCQCEDAKKFTLSAGRKKKCKTVRKRQCKNSTTKNGTLYSDFCPKKCGTCYVYPSESPSQKPSPSPSKGPTGVPSSPPSKAPSDSPSGSPSNTPSVSPSSGPTSSPSLSLAPTFKGQTRVPSALPSAAPSNSPSGSPTETPQSTVQLLGRFPEGTTTESVRIDTETLILARIAASAELAPGSRFLADDVPSVEVTVGLVICDPLFGGVVVTSTCMSIVLKVEVVASSNTFSPDDFTAQIELDVTSGKYQEEAEAVGIIGDYILPPSEEPSAAPSPEPSSSPSSDPSSAPSVSPSSDPSSAPSVSPSSDPSSAPSVSPSSDPSSAPSLSPSVSLFPSKSPSTKPSTSSFPSLSPTIKSVGY